MTADQPECKNCDSSGWVCEGHKNEPWNDGNQKCCGGAGAPCPVCNVTEPGQFPRMAPGTRVMFDKDGWHH